MMAVLSQKERLAKQFSKYASNYDEVAQVQSDIGFDAIQDIKSEGKVALDIGSGTGRLTSLLQPRFEQVTGVDLSPGMVAYASQKYTNVQNLQFMQGDAEALPIVKSSVDFVFSSMTLQWCNPINKSLDEIMRVLRPGGQALLVVMCEGSMDELRSAWAHIDPNPRVNQFASVEHLTQQAKQIGFGVEASRKSYKSWHNDIAHLLNSIRQIGAGVVANSHPGKPLTRQTLMQLESVYSQQFAQQNRLPLTYNLIHLNLTKIL